MKKIMKIVLISIFCLFAFVTIAGYVILTKVDFNAYKNQIVKIVKNATNRDLTIGNIKVTPSFNPKLEINDVTFSNASWAQQKEMVKIEQVDLKIAVIPLLKKSIVIDSFVIKNADIYLQENVDGENNWTFNVNKSEEKQTSFELSLIKTAKAQELSKNSGLDFLKSLVIKEVVFDNVKVNYIDKYQKVQKYNVSTLDLAQNTSNNIDFNFDINSGLYKGKGEIGKLSLLDSKEGYPVVANLDVLGVKAFVDAKLYDVLNNVSFEGNVKVEKFLGKNSGYNESANVIVKGDLGAVNVEIKEFSLADNKIFGNADILLDKGTPFIKAVFASDKVNVKSFEKAKKEVLSLSFIKTANAEQLASNEAIPYDLLSIINADVELKIKEIVKGNKVIAKNLLSTVKIDKGVANINISKGVVFNGDVVAKALLNGKNRTLKIDASLVKLDIKNLLSVLNTNLVNFQLKEGGILDLYVDLSGSGNTYADVLNSIDGRVVGIVDESKLTVGSIGKISGNVITQLFNTLNVTKENDNLNMKCAVVRADFNNGIAKLPSGIVFNSDKFTIVANGNINLKKDKLDISVKPFAGKITDTNIAKALSSLVKLTGSIQNPKIGIDSTNAIKTIVGVTTAGPVYLGAQMWLENDGSPCYSALEGTQFSDRFPKPKNIVSDTTDGVNKAFDDGVDLVKSTTEGIFNLLSGSKRKDK